MPSIGLQRSSALSMIFNSSMPGARRILICLEGTVGVPHLSPEDHYWGRVRVVRREQHISHNLHSIPSTALLSGKSAADPSHSVSSQVIDRPTKRTTRALSSAFLSTQSVLQYYKPVVSGVYLLQNNLLRTGCLEALRSLYV
jgi:hypothetical protein